MGRGRFAKESRARWSGVGGRRWTDVTARSVADCRGVAFALSGAIGIGGTEIAAAASSSSSSTLDQGNSAVHVFVNSIIVLFGLLVVALEARISLVFRAITRDARFLTRVWGRGIFYMFLGTLALSKFELACDTDGFSRLPPEPCGVGDRSRSNGHRWRRHVESSRISGVDAIDRPR